jgi:hypothetical protein
MHFSTFSIRIVLIEKIVIFLTFYLPLPLTSTMTITLPLTSLPVSRPLLLSSYHDLTS